MWSPSDMWVWVICDDVIPVMWSTTSEVSLSDMWWCNPSDVITEWYVSFLIDMWWCNPSDMITEWYVSLSDTWWCSPSDVIIEWYEVFRVSLTASHISHSHWNIVQTCICIWKQCHLDSNFSFENCSSINLSNHRALTLCLPLFNLPIGSFTLLKLKLLFLKLTMTSSLRWIMVGSLHTFLSIIPFYSVIFKIGLVLLVFLWIGSHPISHLALRQSPSMNVSLQSLSCSVPQGSILGLLLFTLYTTVIITPLGLVISKINSNIICKLMTPSGRYK